MCDEQVIVMLGSVTHSVGHSMDGRNLANICFEKSLSSPKFFGMRGGSSERSARNVGAVEREKNPSSFTILIYIFYHHFACMI